MKITKNKITSILVSSIFLGSSFSAFADSTSVDTSQSTPMGYVSSTGAIAPPQLNGLINKGVISVIETFPHGPFTGWLVKNGAEHHLYWSTKDNYVVAGPLIDDKGINLTQKYLAEKKPVPSLNSEYDRLVKEGTYFSSKKNSTDEKVMYMFVEPFCGWCSKLISEFEPLINEGFEVRFVPVSFLSAQSPDVLEYMLHADDQYAALKEHEVNRKAHNKLNMTPATSETRDNLARNSMLMKSFGINGTPGMVYKYKGKAVKGGYLPPAQMRLLVEKIKNQ